MDEIQICGYALILMVCYYREKLIKETYRKRLNDDNYKIYKNGFSDDVLSTALFPYRTIDDILFYEELFDTDYPEELKEVFSKFVNYVDPINLEFSLVNLNSIKVSIEKGIKGKINTMFPSFTLGFYQPFCNKITLFLNNKRVLSHEFLHMASTAYYNPLFCGFHIIDDIYEFGTGLNEGYTELLNSRIFYDGKRPKSYEYNVEIVKLLECFFDNYKDMEWAYFHNDINLVYSEFCKYGTRDEFFLIMDKLDDFSKNFILKDIVDYYKLKFKLYEIIKRSKDDKKIKKFEKILYSSKVDFIISKAGVNVGDFDDFSKTYEKKA